MQGHHQCPSCNSENLLSFFKIPSVPVHSCLMHSTLEEALNFPTGDIELTFCEECGFISNQAYQKQHANYSPVYEDQQSYSPTFNQFSDQLVNQLIQKYDLHNKHIVEIGCGKADFLSALCERGNNQGIGIDPSCNQQRLSSTAKEKVTLINEYYSEQHANQIGDMIVCRHTLEHIDKVGDFVSIVRRSLNDHPNTIVFFELPETKRILTDCAFWDIYYEHCSYFTPGSLSRLFRRNKFSILDLSLEYDDQYLTIEATPTAENIDQEHPNEESITALKSIVTDFSERAQIQMSNWQQKLSEYKAKGLNIAIWGSGSKCLSFITSLKITDMIDTVTDINPHRHHKFIPGIGIEVMPPEYLRVHKPDVLIIMNAVYEQEIKKSLANMALSPKIIAL